MDSNRNSYSFITGTCVFFIGFNFFVATHPISLKNFLESWHDDVKYKLNPWSRYDNPEEGSAREGDIKEPSRKTMLKDRHLLWPNGIVRYFVDDTIANMPEKLAILEEAMKKIMESTCVRFVRIYPDSNGNFAFRTWVNMTGREPGCFADLGYPEISPSTLNLNVEKCFRTKGHALHEILHTLGAAHEHMRPDRNKYVKILWHNIRAGGKGNFEIMNASTVETYGLPYDYESIMHYSMTAFSKNKALPTIMPRRKGVDLGQRSHLSPIDIQKLLITYKCGKYDRPSQYGKKKANNRNDANDKNRLTIKKPKKTKIFISRHESKKHHASDPWAKFRIPKFLNNIFSIADSDESLSEEY